MAIADETVRLLLIEDDATSAAVVTEQLRGATAARFDVTHVGSLADAEASLDAAPFHIALVDLGLPDAFGLQALQVMMAHAAGPACVVMSATDDPELALAAMELGAQDFVQKGRSSPDSLVRRLLAARARKGRIDDAIARSREATALLRSLPGPLLMVDDQGRVVFANDAAGALYGRDPTWLVGQRFRTEVPDAQPLLLHIQPHVGDPIAVVARASTGTWRGVPCRQILMRRAEEPAAPPENA